MSADEIRQMQSESAIACQSFEFPAHEKKIRCNTLRLTLNLGEFLPELLFVLQPINFD